MSQQPNQEPNRDTHTEREVIVTNNGGGRGPGGGIVAIVAIIVLVVVGYFAVQALTGSGDGDGPSLDVNIDNPVDGGGGSEG